jgi:hypothetical protein
MNTRNRFSLRTLRDLGYVGYSKAEDDTVAGGGGGDPVDPPAKPGKKDKTPPEAKKVELTEDDLAARLAAAREEERQKLADERKKEKDDADRAEGRGEGRVPEARREGKGRSRSSRPTRCRRRTPGPARRGQRRPAGPPGREAPGLPRQRCRHHAPRREKLAEADAKPDDVRKVIESRQGVRYRTPRRGVAPPPPPAPAGRAPRCDHARKEQRGRRSGSRSDSRRVSPSF